MSGAPLQYLSGAGEKAYPVVGLTWGLLTISVVVVAIVSVLVLWGVLARKRRGVHAPLLDEPVERPPGGLRWIAIGVGVSSIALVVSLFWTVAVLAKINAPAEPAVLTVEVVGHQWWWEVRYLGRPSQVFATANEIHIPTGRPVRVRLKAADVIHSFWVPALSGKLDTIPGQTNVGWLEADKPGRYRGQCTEYCGFQHAHMALEVVAEPPADFAAWRARQLAPATLNDATADGRALFVARCGSCHSVRGTAAGGNVAPDLTHLMSRATLAAGTVPNTTGALAAWVADPQALKPGTLMPSLQLSGAELATLTHFLSGLS